MTFEHTLINLILVADPFQQLPLSFGQCAIGQKQVDRFTAFEISRREQLEGCR